MSSEEKRLKLMGQPEEAEETVPEDAREQILALWVTRYAPDAPA